MVAANTGTYKYRITLPDGRASGWVDWHTNPAASVIAGIKIGAGRGRTITRRDAVPLAVGKGEMIEMDIDLNQPIRPPEQIMNYKPIDEFAELGDW